MGSFSIWHWLVVGILIMLLFGRGKFSGMMGDVAKGIKEFKKGMAEDEEAKPAPRIDSAQPATSDADKQADKTS
jgi:sec-independent protein translocase protein TatA